VNNGLGAVLHDKSLGESFKHSAELLAHGHVHVIVPVGASNPANHRVSAFGLGRGAGLRARLNDTVAQEEKAAEKPGLAIKPTRFMRQGVVLEMVQYRLKRRQLKSPFASVFWDAEVGDVANCLKVEGKRAAGHAL
jgi:hypothetical protein